MKALIFFIFLFLFIPVRSFSGEIISSSIAKEDGAYHIKIEISVNAGKKKVMEIFNNPEKLKSLSHLIRESGVVERCNGGAVKKIRVTKICFYICLQLEQAKIVETGDDPIVMIIPDQTNFNPAEMRMRISEGGHGKTIISCKMDVEPKTMPRLILSLVSEGKINKKLNAAGTAMIKKIEAMAKKDGLSALSAGNK